MKTMKTNIMHRLALTALSLAVTAFGVTVSGGHAQAAKKMTVAVMEFDNGSTDRQFDPLGKGLAAMVTTDLDAVGQFTVVERQRLADIKAELKLGKSKAFNKKTTAKVGKLVGASHLVVGAFTVLGAKMRLDARMVAVKTGKVVATGEVSGDKDAFFELEKGLVKQMIKGVGVKLAPKERAKLAKLHTADFKAFKKFSDGLSHFDSKNYQAAVEAMKAASDIDADFKLAKISLEKYEELVTQAEGKADAAKVAEIEMRKLKQDKKAQREALLVSQLSGVVKRKGGKTMDGQLAIHILYDMYSGSWGSTFLHAMRSNGDSFALDRTADKFAQAYWGNGMRRPGGLPPYISGIAYATPPKNKKEFNRFFADAKKRAPSNGWAKYLSNWDRFADRLYLDGRTRAKAAAKLARKGDGVVAGDCRYLKGAGQKKCVRKMDSRRYKAAADLAKRYGQYDLSTQLYMRASKLGTDSGDLKRIANEVKQNRDAARALASVPSGVKPWAMSTVRATINGYRELDRNFKQDSLDARSAGRWLTMHRWPKQTARRIPVLVNGTATWALNGLYHTFTGMRSDFFRTDEIRYMLERAERRPSLKNQSVLVHGDSPRNDFSLSFTAVTKPAKVFAADMSSDYDKKRWNALGAAGQKAHIHVLFGLRDVQAEGDTGTMAMRRGTAVQPRPMRGYAVRIGGGRVQLVSFVQKLERKKHHTGIEMVRLQAGFDDKVLASWKTSATNKDSFKVKVSRRGGTVTVSVGGSTWSKSVGEQLGFTGFHFSGTGYGAIRKPRLK